MRIDPGAPGGAVAISLPDIDAVAVCRAIPAQTGEAYFMSKAQMKKEYDRVGRSFSLLFNRSTMYQLDHPYTTQSIKDFFRTIGTVLNYQPSLVVIMNRDQFFIEDEPLDPRLNVTRMVAHFKKTGLQSLSFYEGLQSNDISEFIRVFIDLAAFPNVEAMRRELGRVGIEAIKINHVVYRKVTEDDAVVSKDVLKQSADAASAGPKEDHKKSILGVVAGGLVMEELEQALSLRFVIDNPGAASRTLIDSDLTSARQGGEGAGGPSGPVIVKQLNRLRSEVDKVTPEMEGANLAELAEAVFDMKRKLLSGIEAQKSTGVVYADEAGIHQEANELTDRVFVQLVRDEYRKGAITVKRLAQIIRRLVPDPQELQRLMPALKEALIGEGMPLTDYMGLIGALGKELQSQGLAQVLTKGAEDIGVESEDLIQEVLSNPQIAAELIYLSAEIRKGAGDEKLLSDLLVEYIERIGGQLTLEAAAGARDGEEEEMDQVLRRVQSQIVDRLKSKDVQGDVLREVEERLSARMEAMIAKLQIDFDKWGGGLPAAAGDLKKFSILGALEEGTAEDEDLARVLEQVRAGLHERDVDENNFQEIYSEIVKGKIAWKKQQEKKELPSGVMNRTSILFFVEKEMQRAVRYGTPFSIILFAIVRAIPREKVPAGAVRQKEVYQAVVDRMARVVRDPDMVGSLDKSRMLWLLPMTMPDDIKIARERILNDLHRHIYNVNGVPLKIRMASSIMDFSHEEMPPLRTFLKRAERGLHEIVVRLKNIRELM
ncbi:MAG: GGDEF domain-containing protein [Desulfosarcina sp.]|nr:GGDEF domain-containing protein [Desulfobacterales bacterium]